MYICWPQFINLPSIQILKSQLFVLHTSNNNNNENNNTNNYKKMVFRWSCGLSGDTSRRTWATCTSAPSTPPSSGWNRRVSYNCIRMKPRISWFEKEKGNRCNKGTYYTPPCWDWNGRVSCCRVYETRNITKELVEKGRSCTVFAWYTFLFQCARGSWIEKPVSIRIYCMCETRLHLLHCWNTTRSFILINWTNVYFILQLISFLITFIISDVSNLEEWLWGHLVALRVDPALPAAIYADLQKQIAVDLGPLIGTLRPSESGSVSKSSRYRGFNDFCNLFSNAKALKCWITFLLIISFGFFFLILRFRCNWCVFLSIFRFFQASRTSCRAVRRPSGRTTSRRSRWPGSRSGRSRYVGGETRVGRVEL